LNFVSEHAHLLKDARIESLFEFLGKIPEIAPQLGDPEGMLLATEQRIQRARSLVSVAVGLFLVEHGWKLHASPGELYLINGADTINPFDLIRQISDGEGKEAWQNRCQQLGLAGPLVIGQTQPTAAGIT
jgi:hypothetical protein